MKRALAIFILLLWVALASAGNLPKREFRGAWLHIVGRYNFTRMSAQQVQENICTTLDSLRAAGCNAVIFQVRPQADAFYISQKEPWTRYLTGEQGRAPEPLWDPLAFAIEQAHRRGMELHAWLNPYRVTSNAKDKLCENHLYYRESWRFVKYGEQIYFDPGIPQNITYLADIVKDIVTRYDVDAIHFDDYFYPYPIKGREFPDDISFQKYGTDFVEKDDWRRDNCSCLIREVSAVIKRTKPWVRFGISPFGIHRNKSQDPEGSDTSGLSTFDALYADVPFWVEEGYVDYFAPQLYWKIGHPVADYHILINWWNNAHFGDHLYIGQNIATLREPDLDNPETTQLARKMALSRDLPNVAGNIWWPGWDLAAALNDIADSLRTKYQKDIALIPAYTHIDSVEPLPVENLRVQGRTISWESPATEDPMQKPGFYVVYRFPLQGGMDMEDSEFIYLVTREPKVTLPETPVQYRYIITECDRCWNESIPSEAVTL